jgi:hypothetical protein
MFLRRPNSATTYARAALAGETAVATQSTHTRASILRLSGPTVRVAAQSASLRARRRFRVSTFATGLLTHVAI